MDRTIESCSDTVLLDNDNNMHLKLAMRVTRNTYMNTSGTGQVKHYIYNSKAKIVTLILLSSKHCGTLLSLEFSSNVVGCNLVPVDTSTCHR